MPRMKTLHINIPEVSVEKLAEVRSLFLKDIPETLQSHFSGMSDYDIYV